MVLFQFDYNKYEQKQVENFTFEECERESNINEQYVLKIGNELESILNNERLIDVERNWYRVFPNAN